MRKISCWILAMALMLTLSVTAEAEETSPPDIDIEIDVGEGEIEIEAVYETKEDNKEEVSQGTQGKVYYVVLDWQTSGSIIYGVNKVTCTYKWDGEGRMDTSIQKEKLWWTSNAAVEISASNRGNTDVLVTCSEPEPVAGLTITGSYGTGGSRMSLSSAAVSGFEDTGQVQSATTVYSITGITGDTWHGVGNIGAITVTIIGQ